MKKTGLEKEYQNTICEYLSLKRYFFWRQNTTPVFDKTRGTFRSMPKYSKNGIPDIILLTEGNVVFIEVKRPSGKLSDHQATFKEECDRQGIKYIIATVIDDLVKNGI